MVEAEWGFVRELKDVMDLTEGLIRNVVVDAVRGSIESPTDDMHVLWKDRNEIRAKELNEVVSMNWARISYTDAIRILQEHHTSTDRKSVV